MTGRHRWLVDVAPIVPRRDVLALAISLLMLAALAGAGWWLLG